MRQFLPTRPEPTLHSLLRNYWSEAAAVAAAIDLDRLEAAALTLLDCQAAGRVVFVAGNGGSAATASHFACDLAKGTRGGGDPTFRVVALTDNMALLTAWANDAGYERVFAEQLASLAQPGDVLVAISVSGNSPNVIAAVDSARALGLATIGLTGQPGGLLAQLADLPIQAPSHCMEIVEDVHSIVAHSLCVALRASLAASPPHLKRDPHNTVPTRLAG